MPQRLQAGSVIHIDNERVLVTEWRFPPGSETGWHRHHYDYMVVPQTTGDLLMETKEGNDITSLEAGKPYFRNAGVEHNVVNPGKNEFVFIEIEMK